MCRGILYPRSTATALHRCTTGRAGKAQSTHRQGAHSTHRSKNKSVHNWTFICAMMVAWSTRDQTKGSSLNHSTCSPHKRTQQSMSQGSVLFLMRRDRGRAIGTTEAQTRCGANESQFLPP